MRQVLFTLVLAGCAADQPAPQTSEVGVTVLPVTSTATAAPLSYASTKPELATPTATAVDREAAERYFTEARSMMQSGKVELACGLFQRSFDADPALGTLLNLGDCNEKLGNILAACNAYRDAEAQARGAGQDARGEVARSRAEKLGCR